MRTYFVLCSALLLAGCTALQPEVRKLPKWQHTNVTRFGDWSTEPGSCVLSGNSPEVKTATTGKLEGTFSGSTIELRMFFAAPLARPPRAALSNLQVPLKLEGADQTYTLQLPYTPPAAAHYIQPDSFLTITYQPAQASGELEVNFALPGLVTGVTYLSRTCK